MEACSERIVLYMHEYLDEDIPEDHKKMSSTIWKHAARADSIFMSCKKASFTCKAFRMSRRLPVLQAAL